jgi:signal transduction histidine kinase
MRGGLRRRLTTTVVVVAAATLVLLIAVFNFALRSSLDGDADSLLRARAQAALEGVRATPEGVSVRERSDEGVPDAQVWVYSGDRNVERPPVEPELDTLAAALGQAGHGTAEDPATDTRLLASPILADGGEVGTVVAAVSLAPYETTARRALLGSILLGALLLAAITIATRLIVSRSLRPVAEMTIAATDWSAHDLDRRFDAGPPSDELTELAATFDRMLDRMAALVRHERNFSAEISHELRTPLAAIAAEAELALRRIREPGDYRKALERISRRARDLTGILETLLTVARAETPPAEARRCELTAAARTAAADGAETAAACGVEIRVHDPGHPVLVEADAEAVGRLIAPILENACAYAEAEVTLSAATGPGPSRLTVSDDGPGFRGDDAGALLEPGRRGDAPRNGAVGGGTGLGLSLARRLATAMGGQVGVAAGSGRGEVVITLPPAPDDGATPERARAPARADRGG